MAAGLAAGLAFAPVRAAAQTEKPAAPIAKRVTFAGGRVSFAPPPGFLELTPAQIAAKYPSVPADVRRVFADDKRARVSIMVTFSPAKVSPAQLPTLKTVLETALAKQMPGLQWITRELTTLGGVPCVHLEMTSQALDTTIHNDMYFTSFAGKMLGFNFNATVDQQKKAQTALRQSRDSIKIAAPQAP